MGVLVQGMGICEDIIPKPSERQCVVWSVVSTTKCDNFGSLEWEKYMAKEKGCKVRYEWSKQTTWVSSKLLDLRVERVETVESGKSGEREESGKCWKSR
jgi:hypothetical protein